MADRFDYAEEAFRLLKTVNTDEIETSLRSAEARGAEAAVRAIFQVATTHNGVRALRGSGGLMGAASYNRGSQLVSREADERMPLALSRADRQAHKDEVARLREQVAALERELRRARRCLAAERLGREQLRVRLGDEERSHALSVKWLCRLAFPGDES